MARLKQRTATSAGGIVVRYDSGIPQFIAGRRKDPRTWTLPKGTPHPGETTEQTALREVGEETGLEVRIVEPIDSISYDFTQRGARIHKTVFYFLMEPTGGDLAGHDHEFDEVRWFDLAEAGGVLTFESERSLVERAADRVASAAVGGAGRAGAGTDA
ncbi:MAG: NUDIX hydrolase [Chloroflexota bacterium]|nr:NUDIX hydrolase [Chloroflexota bacterium]